MSLHVSPKLREVATAAGLDLDRYYRENIRPVNENPADAPEDPYWPELHDLDAEAGIHKVNEVGLEATKAQIIGGIRFKGWQLAEGFWIGAYLEVNADLGQEWNYCCGRGWDDIWQG